MTLSYSNCKNNCFSTLKREQLLKEPAACGKSVFLPMVKEKKGALRVVYVDFTVQEKIYLIHAYSKSEKDNLSKEERNNIKKLIEYLEKNI